MSPRRSKAAAAEEQIEIPSRNGTMDGAKRAVLDKAVGDILKRYGDGSIMRLGEAQHMQTEAFPTGSLSLDIALGVGGVPRGRRDPVRRHLAERADVRGRADAGGAARVRSHP